MTADLFDIACLQAARAAEAAILQSYLPDAIATSMEPDAILLRIVLADPADLPDCSSPDDWPEAMLVTGNELQALIEQACEAIGVAETLEPGIAEIAAERRRQREVEGWTEAHDDEHARGEMAQAAACYAISAPIYDVHGFIPSRLRAPQPALKWPWGPEWWKPRSQIRNLERAGALIAAEIARIKRQQQKAPIPPVRAGAE